MWQGGVIHDKSGYVLVHSPNHPRATSGGYVRKHRLVAELSLGRYLEPQEVVHHIDDDPKNNSTENLLVFDHNSQHLAASLKGKCPQWTEDGKRRVAEGLQKGIRNRTGSELDAGELRRTLDRSIASHDTDPQPPSSEDGTL